MFFTSDVGGGDLGAFRTPCSGGTCDFCPSGIYVIFATSNFATRYPFGGGPRSRAAPMCIRTPPLEISHAPKKQRPGNRPVPGYIGSAISVLSINTSADLIGADTPRTCAKATWLSRSPSCATTSDGKWALRNAQSATTSANAAAKENTDASAPTPAIPIDLFLFVSVGVWYSCECGFAATILGFRDAPSCGFS